MIHLDRRQLIVGAAFGLGGLMLPGGRAFGQAMAAARGFTHNVASGEPADDSVLLWTRYVGDGDSVHIRAEISATPDFAHVLGGAQVITGPWRDWTVKATVDGLSPGTRYFYRFIGPDGSFSPVGRTKTLPIGAVSRFGIGIFSCSNLPVGAFNAYAHAAARDDLDLMVHLGDYFYEYKRGGYPSDSPRWDLVQPQSECLNLADYRLRYASYRADPDLQAIHARHPMLASMDDHESANDSWEGGAQNHQAEEGDWTLRKIAALQAWREWMPVADIPWGSYDIGDLATLFRAETRLLNRSRQFEIDPLFEKVDPAAALAAFKAKDWVDPARTMMGTSQESWLYHGFRKSVAAKKKWQLVGTGTQMGYTYTPQEALSWVAPDATERNRHYVQTGVALAKAGLPSNMDNWNGYPAARERLLSAAQATNANLVMLCGDSHNAWAYELSNNGKRAGVEFAGHAVTSSGYENSTKGIDPKVIAAALVKSSPELKWCDTSRRGYMALTLTPSAATNEWVFMQTIATRSVATQPSQRIRTQRGSARLEMV